MKKTITKTVIIVFALLMTKLSLAQKGLQLNLDYNIATPLGKDFKRHVDKTSFGSFQASLLYGITPKFKLGVQSSHTDFHQKKTAAIENSIKVTPVLLKAEYSFIVKGTLRPFIGFGTGFNAVRVDKRVNDQKHISTYTKWGYSGDAGVLIALTRSGKYGIRVSTSYNDRPLKKEQIKRVDSWDVQAGLTIHL